MSWASPAWTRSWSSGVIVGLATLGPIGRKLPAPGTWGSLVGTLFFALAVAPLSLGGNLIVSLVLAALAVGICGEAEIRLGKQDPGEVILDEFIAMPLCFLGWPALLAVMPAWAALGAGFALFRFFDIIKPLGIKRLQHLPGGWGVVVDDVVAALVACATLHGGVWLWMLTR